MLKAGRGLRRASNAVHDTSFDHCHRRDEAGRDAWRRCRRKARWHFRHDGKGGGLRVRSRASTGHHGTSGRSFLAFRRARRNRKTRYRAPRFNNRVRSKHKGWLAPSVENRIQAHMSRIEAVCRLLPVTKIVIETASFDIQKIRNPEVEGTGYQQGDQLGFWKRARVRSFQRRSYLSALSRPIQGSDPQRASS